jgi:hypothetical protein
MRTALSSGLAPRPCARPCARRGPLAVRAEAPGAPVKEKKPEGKGLLKELSGLGDALGPIGLTYSGGVQVRRSGAGRGGVRRSGARRARRERPPRWRRDPRARAPAGAPPGPLGMLRPLPRVAACGIGRGGTAAAWRRGA